MAGHSPDAAPLPPNPGVRVIDSCSSGRISGDLVWVGVGSNIGPFPWRWQHIRQRLESQHWLDVLDWAPHFINPASGPGVRGRFWNSVAVAQTRLPPPEFLRRLKTLERRSGRASGVGDRTVDFDILWWRGSAGWKRLRSRRLRIPHPAAHRRTFVMMPASALAGRWPLPPAVQDKIKIRRKGQ